MTRSATPGGCTQPPGCLWRCSASRALRGGGEHQGRKANRAPPPLPGPSRKSRRGNGHPDRPWQGQRGRAATRPHDRVAPGHGGRVTCNMQGQLPKGGGCRPGHRGSGGTFWADSGNSFRLAHRSCELKILWFGWKGPRVSVQGTGVWGPWGRRGEGLSQARGSGPGSSLGSLAFILGGSGARRERENSRGPPALGFREIACSFSKRLPSPSGRQRTARVLGPAPEV